VASLLKSIFKAMSVLMLEMTINCECVAREQLEQDQQQVVTSLEKAIDFLWLQAATSKSAVETWTISRELFQGTMALHQGTRKEVSRSTREISPLCVGAENYGDATFVVLHLM